MARPLEAGEDAEAVEGRDGERAALQAEPRDDRLAPHRLGAPPRGELLEVAEVERDADREDRPRLQRPRDLLGRDLREVGAVEQVLEVAADAGAIETTTSDLGTTVSKEKVVDLPLAVSGNMRHPGAFVFLAPGVTGDTSNTQVNGSQNRSKEILLDGVDLREYDLDELRQRIGVIFQDFVKYQLSVRENIGFGQIDRLDDAAQIASSAERGGADSVVAELPEGMDTMLGRWFEKGHELSGGQWQKIALSRAFMRDGEVLVLDEPTSALDAEREYEIFQRFRDLTEGKIAVLISHRFSTVRMADRIAVIEDGQISELGSHAELLALGGTYARLFEMQAEGYR
jgi:ABC-type transport system involved in cytochrome bd biosynthesis fused ATPase/permease subunit